MRGHQSAYAALGLAPGADRTAIEEAYRRLIKQYHPDKSGGDGERAAELNRAYRELRHLPLDLLRSAPAPVPTKQRRRRRVGAGRLLATTALLAAAALVSASTSLHRSSWWPVEPRLAMLESGNSAGAAFVAPYADLSEPISETVIARAVADAVRLHSTGDLSAMLDYSRTCRATFRDQPSLTWFDSCAAYDEAVVLLESRDPIGDSGPFNAAAVTAREMGQARLLSDDSMAIDARVHDIRSDVQMALLPKLADATIMSID